MNVLLLTTCGTSVLSNDAGPLGAVLRRCANERTLPAADAALLEPHLAARTQRLLAASPEEASRYSAEVNGVLRVLASAPHARVQHVVIHTDTALGTASADAVAQWIRQHLGHGVELVTSPGLQTTDAETFREAVSDLSHALYRDWLVGYRARRFRIVFNLTGGFKSVNGFLQAFGMLYADETVYLFESSSNLMKIPRLPATPDLRGSVGANLQHLRRLAVGYPVHVHDFERAPDTLFVVVDDAVTRSVWGDFAWSEHKDEFLADGPLEPLSRRLKYSPRFASEFTKLPEPSRRAMLQARLDELAARLDGVRVHRASETVKPLKGHPAPGSTHEVYAWSDADARRIFGHHEGDTFVLDQLSEHL
jgi:putative CRISPR-associated protein (TIGR02619 family)